MHHSIHRLIAFAAAVSIAGSAVAQGICHGGQTVPDFGYGFMSCDNCLSVVVRNGLSVPHFGAPPTLHQIRADGPGGGLLSEGDTLLSVDGLSITSDAAANRLTTYRPVASRLTLRRNGVERTVAIAARPVCVGVMPARAVVDRQSGTTLRDTTGDLAVTRGADFLAGGKLSAGALGVAIACGDCNLNRASGRSRWEFTHFPVVAAVDPGSLAAGMGLRPGDTLWTIDDTPLTSPIGGEMLGAVTRGATFKLGWRRSGKPYSAWVRDWHVQSSGPTVGQLDFSQGVGAAQVDVHGRGRLWTRSGPDGELEIQIDSAVVTIRSPAARDSARVKPPR